MQIEWNPGVVCIVREGSNQIAHLFDSDDFQLQLNAARQRQAGADSVEGPEARQLSLKLTGSAAYLVIASIDSRIIMGCRNSCPKVNGLTT